MSRKRAQRKRKVTALVEAEERAPSWDMHEYHQRTGLYRAHDLTRLLGDPRDQLVGEPADGMLVACGISKK
jgi:hypothetical protein